MITPFPIFKKKENEIKQLDQGFHGQHIQGVEGSTAGWKKILCNTYMLGKSIVTKKKYITLVYYAQVIQHFYTVYNSKDPISRSIFTN